VRVPACAAVVLCVTFATRLVPAHAQEAASPPPEIAAEGAVEIAAPAVSPEISRLQTAPFLVRVPALTPVVVKVDEEVTSKKNKSGDKFRIVIAEDVRLGDVVVIPAGATGEGEVVHAAKAGAGGKAGELILAARFVRVGDIEVRLRSMVLGGAGRDNSDSALATSMFVGVFAMAVRGGTLIVPPGTVASAKTAADIELPATDSALPPQAKPVETTTEGEDHVSQTT
jgi:hypothetical protein